MLVGADSTTGNPPAMPGYTLPGEHTAQGTIFPVGTLLMQKVPGAGNDSFAGNFMLALGEKAADLPPDITNFGLTLDGTDTLNAIDKAGTDSGRADPADHDHLGDHRAAPVTDHHHRRLTARPGPEGRSDQPWSGC